MSRLSKLSLLWLLPAVVAAGCGSAQRVTVSNSLPFDREGEMAQLPVGELKSSLRKSGFVVTDPAGNEVPYQLTSDSLLIFLASVAANASAVYTVKPGTPAPVKPRVYGRFFPEHKDNMNWENDKAAYTAYGPALQARGERGFGYDVWTKNVDTLVLELRYKLATKKKSMHKDHGNGMDAYIVANTLGGGTAALLDDSGEIIFPWCWKEYEILDNGPLRFSVRLTYNPLKAEEDTAVVETRLITLDQGSNFNRTEVRYDGLSRPRRVAPGIVVHKQNPREFGFNAKEGWMAYVDSTDNPRNGNGVIYLGAVAPADSIIYKPVSEPARDADAHLLAVSEYKPGDTLTYLWGSAWSKNPTAPADTDEWKEFMRRAAACFRNPLKTSVK